MFSYCREMIEGRLKSNKIKQQHLQTGLPILHINEYKDAYLVNTSVRLFFVQYAYK